MHQARWHSRPAQRLARFAALAVTTSAALGAGLLVTPGPAHADDDGTNGSSLARAAAYAEPSTVYLKTSFTAFVYDKLLEAKDGSTGDYIRSKSGDAKKFTVRFTCTGFIVSDDGYVATAGHCLQVDSEVIKEIEHEAAQYFLSISTPGKYTEAQLLDDYTVYHTVDDAGNVEKGPVTGVQVVLPTSATGRAPDVQTVPAEIASQQTFDEGDGALVKIDVTGLNALPLTDTTLSVGDPVVAVGYPASVEEATDASLQPSFEPGQVNSAKTVGDGAQQVYQVDAEMGPGMSGGPAVDADGKATGFNSFATTGSTAAFNFIRPTATIQSLMQSAGAENRLTSVTQQYRAGIAALYSGDRNQALQALGAVVKAQPNNKIAAVQLEKAQDLPLKDARAVAVGSNGGHVVLWVLLSGITVVLVLGAVGFGVMSLRKRGRAPTAYPTGRPQPDVRRYPPVPPPPPRIPTERAPQHPVAR